MAHFIYILECKDGSYYTGITWNITKRVNEHSNRLSLATKAKLPIKLVYWERLENRFLAAKREKEIKGWSRVKKQRLISSLDKSVTRVVYTESRFSRDEVRE